MRFRLSRRAAETLIDNTLSAAQVGRVYKLVGVDAGQNLKDRITAMGLNSGAHLRILLNSGHGPVELEVRQTRLGIGRGMAKKIRVQEVAS